MESMSENSYGKRNSVTKMNDFMKTMHNNKMTTHCSTKRNKFYEGSSRKGT